jgi:hypothetical protein
MILNHIGNIYENQSHFQDALSNYQQALTIYRQLLPDTYNDSVQTEKNIQSVIAKFD